MFFIAASYLAHGYSLNLNFDDNLPAEEKKNTLYASAIAPVPALVLAAFINKTVLLIFITGAAVNYLYSSDSFNLKKFPTFNLILNSTGFTLLFAIGWVINKSIQSSFIIISIYIWLGIIPFQIIHMASHKSMDRYWPYSDISSKKLSAITVLLWALYSVLISVSGELDILFSLFTTIYAFIIILLLHRHNSFPVIRNRLRYYNIVFGTLLAVYFYRI